MCLMPPTQPPCWYFQSVGGESVQTNDMTNQRLKKFLFLVFKLNWTVFSSGGRFDGRTGSDGDGAYFLSSCWAKRHQSLPIIFETSFSKINDCSSLLSLIPISMIVAAVLLDWTGWSLWGNLVCSSNFQGWESH